MRVLITGGSGLIGRALTAVLTSGGHEVIILSRSPERVTGLPAGARAERWDAKSAEGWGPLAEGAGAIVNLAGENIGDGRWTAERKRRILQSRLDATHAVVEAVEAASSPPGVLVQASAVGYYGDRGDEVILADDPPADDFLAEVVVAWEAASEPVEALGVRRVISRTGIVLDDQEGPLPRIAQPVRFFIGGPVAGGGQWISWIHREDIADALAYAIEHEEMHGPYNVCAPQPTTNAELTKAVGAALHRPTFMPVPAFAVKLLFGEMAQTVLDSQRAEPKRLLGAGWQPRFVRVEDAVHDLLG